MRDAAQKWLAFGAIVVVAVGVSFGSSAWKKHLKETLPQPNPPVPFPRQTTDPPLTTPATPGMKPKATDPRIVPGGSPESSLAARPKGDTLTTKYAPQHSLAEEIFDAIQGAPKGDLFKAFVVCRGRGKSDGTDDIELRAVLGKTPEMTVAGPKSGGVAYLTAPLVNLRQKDPIELAVVARTARGIDPKLHSRFTYEDAIQKAGGDGDVECLALIGEELQDRIAIDAGRADFDIALLANATLDPSARLWGYPAEDRTTAERSIDDVAALVGWDDPRTRLRVVAHTAALRKIDFQVARVIDDAYRDADKKTTVEDVTIELESFSCDVKTCSAAVLVTNGRNRAVAWKETAVETAFGSKTTIVTVPAGEHDIAPGARTRMKLVGPTSFGSEPAVAQICIDGTCGVIKLH